LKLCLWAAVALYSDAGFPGSGGFALSHFGFCDSSSIIAFDRSLQSKPIVAEFWALRGAFLLLGRARRSVLRPDFIAEHARMLEPAGHQLWPKAT
jgi:hypothetical protein